MQENTKEIHGITNEMLREYKEILRGSKEILRKY